MTAVEGIALARGSLHMSREVYERYFPGVEAVALLRQSDDLLILPVRHAAAGGYILKHRNVAGDRVVNASDFFRAQGIEDNVQRPLAISWQVELSALCAMNAFGLQT
ncbi:MAG TPA: hypothetical protein VN821_07040 [Candidatus Udaeobacter sp.]|nr:hypothetical protein [Candidatus Udaeobacter sp.]